MDREQWETERQLDIALASDLVLKAIVGVLERLAITIEDAEDEDGFAETVEVFLCDMLQSDLTASAFIVGILDGLVRREISRGVQIRADREDRPHDELIRTMRGGRS